jgi:hypothetical protein
MGLHATIGTQVSVTRYGAEMVLQDYPGVI